MKRRPIILVLIGTIVALAGSAVTVLLRQRRCAGAGGRFDAAARQCQLAGGELMDVSAVSDAIAGVVVAVVLAFMLFRIFLAAMGRMAPGSQ